MARALKLKLGGDLTLLLEEVEPPISVFITLQYEQFKIRTGGTHVAYNLPGGQQVKVRVDYVDGAGNPATVDGPVEWSSSDENIATVIVDTSDTQVALVRSGTTLGQAQITARVDADIGTGERELLTLMDVTVVGGEAVAGTISPVGEPEPGPVVEHRRGAA